MKIAVMALIVVGIRKAYFRVFTITKVSCVSDGEACPDPVKAELLRLRGSNILFFNKDEVIVKVLASSVQYTDLEIMSSLPGELSGVLLQASNLAQVAVSSHSGYYQILDNFAVSGISQELDSKLPLITIETVPDMEVGKVITDPWLLGGLKLTDELHKNYINYQTFLLATDSAKVILSSNIEVLFNPKGDLQRQVQAYQVIDKNNFERKPREIDVRFDKPILRFNQ